MSPRTLLLNPRGYFAGDSDSLLSGTILVILHLVVDIVLLIGIMNYMITRMDSPPSGSSILVPLLIVLTVVYVVSWLVVGAVMHVLSGGSSTEGTLGDALGVAGGAYAPEVVTTPVISVYIYCQLTQLSLSNITPQQLEREVQTVVGTAQADLLSIVILFVVTVWSVAILANGIAETHDVPIGTAAFPAALVGFGSIVITLLF